MSEAEVRLILTRAAQTGSDPFLALKKAGLLWDRETMFSARRDALTAAADYLDDMVASALPHEATQSAGAMKQFIAVRLRELARRQRDENKNET